jgi:organic hydroperoxide reductase OsmC/OhrA
MNMAALPHQYSARAIASADSTVTTQIENMPDLEVAPPANFGGPGNIYSPEDLQAAAVASCFILSFKAIATASRLEWDTIEVAVSGTLAQVERVVKFSEFTTSVKLTLAAGSSRDKATRLLEKAEQTCFITNSLTADNQLAIELEGGT